MSSISAAAHKLIVGLLERQGVEPVYAMFCTDAREYRAMLEQRLDAVGDMPSRVRPLVDCGENG